MVGGADIFPGGPHFELTSQNRRAVLSGGSPEIRGFRAVQNNEFLKKKYCFFKFRDKKEIFIFLKSFEDVNIIGFAIVATESMC